MATLSRFSVAALVLLLVVAVAACRAEPVNEWAEFLERPNSATANTVVSTHHGSECGWGSEANEKVFPLEFHRPLFQLVSDGNEAALRVGLALIGCLDGGELEDFYISGSRYFDRDPSDFLLLAKEYELSARDVGTFVSGTPGVDDADSALALLERRRMLLNSVSDERVTDMKSTANAAIDTQVDILRQN